MVIACIRETIKDQRGQENCLNNVRIIVNVTASPDIPYRMKEKYLSLSAQDIINDWGI